jgi:hypothetical protein
VTTTVFGIRHHGPGSARSLVEDLGRLRPDCVLIEGPPEATDLLPLAADKGMRPPVAILVYDPDQPHDAVFYPFAVFSPEWQAIRHALATDVPVRFIDLSTGIQLARMRTEREERLRKLRTDTELETEPEDDSDAAEAEPVPDDVAHLHQDPLGELARAAGEPDGERWWDRLVESRRTAADVFEAIQEAMTAVRSELPDEDPLTQVREAAMRRAVREAEKQGHERIAVICGAWHAPAIVDRPPAAHDDRLLRTMPRPIKVAAAWVPWTYARLAAESGYGAGILSPGWYEHLWKGKEPLSVTWMARVGRVFRNEDLDVSSAHLIEAARLADTLAAMRGRSVPALEELTDAVRSVIGFGADGPLAVVRDRLIVGRQMGRVPKDVPIAPLAADLAREQRRLRLKPEEGKASLDLDLRGATDLARSHLLHRLRVLDVPWGTPERTYGKAGTFHELWSLAWRPDFVVDLIAASRFGTTIAAAAAARAIELAGASDRLADLTQLIESVLLADLRDAVEVVVGRIGEVAAIAADVPALMDALPPLARVVRYGNVRGTDAAAVRTVVDGLVARIGVGVRSACASLDDDAAREMLPRIDATEASVTLLDDAVHRTSWHAAVRGLAEQAGLHGLVAGRATRILHDSRAIDAGETRRRVSLALSRGAEPAAAAAWVEGFLRDSGLVLVHDDALFGVIDGWLDAMGPDGFDAVLPLLRRTVATFPAPERRALADRARGRVATAPGAAGGHDAERATAVMPILARILGLDGEPT